MARSSRPHPKPSRQRLDILRGVSVSSGASASKPQLVEFAHSHVHIWLADGDVDEVPDDTRQLGAPWYCPTAQHQADRLVVLF
jgi:hypothetical protein